MPENPIHILDYAPRPRLWRRRPFRLTVIATVLLALVAAGAYWYPDISFRIRLAYWQRQCMNHVIPPDKVILTADPKLVPILLKDPDYVPTTTPFGPGVLAAYRPRCYREYHCKALVGTTAGDDAVIFMHNLRNRQGTERLVIAFDRGEPYTKSRPEHCITIEVWQPRPLYGELRGFSGGVKTRSIFNLSARLRDNTQRIQLYAGQLDSADPSHFSVRWEATDDPTPTQGVFEFRLSADGARVTLTDLAGDPPSR